MSTNYNGLPANGINSLPPPLPILSSTNTSPIVVQTNSPHSLTTGDAVVVNGHLVNTAANGRWIATVIDTTHFAIRFFDGTASVGIGVGNSGTAAHAGFGVVFAIPSGGDLERAVSVNVALEALADRTAALWYQLGWHQTVGAGGFITIAVGANITIMGVGNVQLESRVINRTSELPAHGQANFTDWVPSSFNRWLQQTANAVILTIPFHVPHGVTLNSVACIFKPPTGHAAFPGGAPATMPTLQIWKCSGTTATQIGATTTDASATVGAYEAAHALTVGGLTEAVNRTTYSYFAFLTSEGGANGIGGTIFYPGLSVQYTTTAYDED